ncbi:hypothetical protein SGPA1_30955 [Streptomyces misionensis JCM 4497]
MGRRAAGRDPRRSVLAGGRGAPAALPRSVPPAGWELECPTVVRFLGGRWWVEAPDGTGQLTDPALLAAAFGPGGYRREAETP